MKEIVIFGAKAFADIAHYYFEHDSEHRVVAFTVDGEYLEEPRYKGLPVVPFEEVGSAYPPERYAMFVAVGIQRVNQQRADKVREAQDRGYRLVSFLSSKADVAPDLDIKPNTMIMERATIQPFVSVGCNTIIWSTSRIGFHNRIGNHCWIVCALFGESVTLGDHSFVGLNATVGPFVSIGQRNVIGAGALILKNTDDDQVYRGKASTPARVPSHRLRKL